MSIWLADVAASVQEWHAHEPVTVAVCGVLLVAAWIVVLLPSSALELALGYLFGVPVGFVLVYSGKVLGSFASFALGRTVIRGASRRWAERHRLLRALDTAVCREPYTICFLARASYVPIALKNYGFAALSVPARPWVIALVSVEVFNSFLLVFLGSAAENLRSSISGARPAGANAPIFIGCSVLVLLALFLGARTRRALADLQATEGAKDPLLPDGEVECGMAGAPFRRPTAGLGTPFRV
jgi:uncharacterized membrane protein YdjX (TVP38/TMEM64 family)